jgi:hypothetical protein
VSLQNYLLSQCLPTDRTHKALFTRQYHKMSFNISSVYEWYWYVAHVYGFSPVWILKRRLSALWVIKRLLHAEHWWGLSLACILESLVKAPFCVKCTPHVWYVYLFAPVCVLTWLLKFGCDMKNFLHMENKCHPSV